MFSTNFVPVPVSREGLIDSLAFLYAEAADLLDTTILPGSVWGGSDITLWHVAVGSTTLYLLMKFAIRAFGLEE